MTDTELRETWAELSDSAKRVLLNIPMAHHSDACGADALESHGLMGDGQWTDAGFELVDWAIEAGHVTDLGLCRYRLTEE